MRPLCSTSRWPTLSQSSNAYNHKIINQCPLRRAEQSLHFASIPTNFIILRPRPRTYASTSPLLLLQLHQQQQLLSINIINSTNHVQHAGLRILLQHLTSHAAYERSGGPPKRPAAKRPCTWYRFVSQNVAKKCQFLSLDVSARSSRILKLFGPAYALLLCRGQCFQFSSPNLQWLTKFDFRKLYPLFG